MTAAENILRKALAASELSSGEWNRIQADLRNRAFFSARVTEARFLHEAREGVAQIAAGKRSASEVRRDLRAVLDAVGAPEGSGDITDPRSRRRLDLIIDTNVRQARGYVNYLEGTTPGALAAFPAQELVRLYDRREKRPWPRIWELSGGKFYGGRMIALKSDPVWRRISRFGNPYPPFDFNSGMGVEDVSRSEAISLGVIDADDPPPKVERKSLNDTLEAEVPFKNGPEWESLKKAFGDQIQRVDKYERVNGKDVKTGSVVKWREHIFAENFEKGGKFTIRLGETTEDLIAKTDKVSPSLAAALAGKQLTVTQAWLDKERRDGTDHRIHFEPMPEFPDSKPLEMRDVGILPALWRGPDRVFESRGSLVIELDTLSDDIFRAVVGLKGNSARLRTFYRTSTPYKKGATS